MKLPHIHLWRRRRDSFRSGKSMIQECRCGRQRMGSLEWTQMTAADWAFAMRRFRELRETTPALATSIPFYGAGGGTGPIDTSWAATSDESAASEDA